MHYGTCKNEERGGIRSKDMTRGIWRNSLKWVELEEGRWIESFNSVILSGRKTVGWRGLKNADELEKLVGTKNRRKALENKAACGGEGFFELGACLFPHVEGAAEMELTRAPAFGKCPDVLVNQVIGNPF